MRFGMDYGGTNLKAGVFDDHGAAVVFREEPLEIFRGEGTLLDNLLLHASDVARGYTLSGGGLAIKGLVNVERGVLEEDIGEGSLLAGIDLRAAFAERLGIPFAVENDARAYAWGEWLFGAGRGSHGMVCMTIGTGVGCAVVYDGKPFQGADPYGALLGGHLSIDRDGPPCPCGSRGCLELYCSATAIHKRVRFAHPDVAEGGVDPLEKFFSTVRRGELGYVHTFREIIDDLALGVVNVIHAYAPDVVVLGGGVMKSADVILPLLTEEVHRMAWTFPRGKVRLRAGVLGGSAASLCAAFHPTLPLP
jgi:glucokinase